MSNSSTNPNPSPTAKVKSLDHLVLTVADLTTTISFYKHHLGMTHAQFTPSPTSTNPNPQARHALSFGTQKINLHLSGHEFEPKAQHVQKGSGDLCFLVEDDVAEVCERLKGEGVEVLEGGGVVERTGAQGRILSVYIRDPDGNLIELSNLAEKQ